MKKGYRENMGGRTHDTDGKPIFGAPTKKPSTRTPTGRLTKAARLAIDRGDRPIDWHQILATQQVNGVNAYCQIETLYCAFRARFIEELCTTVDQSLNIGAQLPLCKRENGEQ